MILSALSLCNLKREYFNLNQKSFAKHCSTPCQIHAGSIRLRLQQQNRCMLSTYSMRPVTGWLSLFSETPCALDTLIIEITALL
jgi:hypothetical protein